MNKIELKIGYEFKDKNLLKTAFTHSSFSYMHADVSNERLEFLGDSVINIVVTKFLYNNVQKPEGELSKIRARLISAEYLSEVIEEKKLNAFLKVENIKKLSTKIKGSLYEAIIGAIFLDGKEKGMDVCSKIIKTDLKLGKFDFDNFTFKDYKSLLQEEFQKRQLSHPEYMQIERTGPVHNPEFTIAVMLEGKELGVGKGMTKKEAENNAALVALKKITEKEDD